MVEDTSRKLVNAFYDALRSRDSDAIAKCLHDDVDWMIMGPVDILPYCGQRYGKKAVVQVFQDIAELVIVSDIVHEFLCVDAGQAAVFGRLIATRPGRREAIRYCVTHFMRFADDRIVWFRSLIDTYDAIEQMRASGYLAPPRAATLAPA